MATECRETKKKISKHKVVKVQAYVVLLLLVLVGGFIGRITAPKEVETIRITKTVSVPSYEVDKLPEVETPTYFDIPLSHSLQNYLYEICADEEVPVTLVMAMIDHESKFNPEVVSATDDYGLMQINKINHDQLAEDYQCADMLNPYQNIFCGVKVLSSYLKEYDNDYVKALMCYNMGEYGAKKSWSNGITNTDYTVSVLGLWEYYEEVKDNAASAGNE
ncbi:lytic transglycosylase domain-containing protein [Lachnospiraceae bacterium OttesenSCG-928-D06]|nr:lytic transglycosylase domain-containing protein [Lachnospiraceae bacterium OttesenSCG-928-D06]